ncbi:hypothetical protein [Sporosarcina sp. P33]|uniref:hypothetical protein n=1 Tax=Sporosarcina sp. P33 TaxID=1930764 RepID=UPI0009C122EB|nr:hypothetical protein [Sporosarcina sp. P33]ARD48814.1 hypothetical protein SporoP33_11660 [Sporosarcina sp. P33]
MIRKALPVVFASALVLTACNTNNGALPDNNETPMQDMERDNTPNGNKRLGPNLDGLEDDNRGGIMNDLDDNNDNGIMNRDRDRVLEENDREGINKQRDGLLDDNNENRGARDDNTIEGGMNGNDAAPDGVIRGEDRKVR